MKRRNVDISKLRRTIKRNSRISEGFPSSLMVYCKLFGLWFCIVLIDYMLDYRFEYLWAFYLVLRALHDSVKYQGLWFSLFFICIVLTSDMIAFFFIPVGWLLVIASTSVWIQCVWCLEKSLCWTNVVLWSLFVYFELAIRFRDFRHWPYHIDLCRPFAANSIGYPVVHLGFGVKTYVCYKLRLRRQKVVAKENEIYMQLMQKSLVSDEQQTVDGSSPSSSLVESSPHHHHSGDNSSSSQSTLLKHARNGHVGNGVIVTNGSVTKSNHHSNSTSNNQSHHQHQSLSSSLSSSYSSTQSPSATSSLTTNGGQRKHKDFVNNCSQTHDDCSSSPPSNLEPSYSRSLANKKRDRRLETQPQTQTTCTVETQTDHDHPVNLAVLRLETDVRRLKSDLQLARNLESDLQSQLKNVHTAEKSMRSEISNLQRIRDDYSSRLNSANSAKQSLQHDLSVVEKKLVDEKKARANVEQQLNSVRMARKQDEQQRQKELAQHQQLQIQHQQQLQLQQQQQSKGECTEQCRKRRFQLDNEIKELQLKLKRSDERNTKSERELKTLNEQKKDTEILLLALSRIEDRNKQLEHSLSSETRVKLDLFSALGEAKRQLQIRESLVENQKREIDELKSKITQVLAVMPSDSFTSPPSSSSSSLSRIRLSTESTLSILQQQSSQPQSQSQQSQSMSNSTSSSSNLDPNAVAYTPKSSMTTSTGFLHISRDPIRISASLLCTICLNCIPKFQKFSAL